MLTLQLLRMDSWLLRKDTISTRLSPQTMAGPSSMVPSLFIQDSEYADGGIHWTLITMINNANRMVPGSKKTGYAGSGTASWPDLELMIASGSA